MQSKSRNFEELHVYIYQGKVFRKTSFHLGMDLKKVQGRDKRTEENSGHLQKMHNSFCVGVYCAGYERVLRWRRILRCWRRTRRTSATRTLIIFEYYVRYNYCTDIATVVHFYAIQQIR